MGWTSSLWSFARDERVVLVTIGLATFSVVSTMVTALAMIRDDNQIHAAEPATQYINQDTEDALQLDTLEKLVRHPTYSVKEVAVKILCDRAVNDPATVEYLLYGITRPDYEERIQCLRALALLTGQTFSIDGLSKLNNEKAYGALVRSIELSLTDVDRPKLDDPNWDEYYLRDIAEKLCLMFILELLNKHGAVMLIKAQFVEKWLAKQDWGESPEARVRNFSHYMDNRNNRIVEIVNQIKHSRRGLRSLRKTGLISKESARRRIREWPDVIMQLGGENGAGSQTEPQVPRAVEHSAEEQRLRRQHREAMVLNDGTRPFGQDDIIERGHSSPIS